MVNFKQHFYGRRKGRTLSCALKKSHTEGGARFSLKLPFDIDAEDVCLEIGFGQGEHFLARAQQFPNTHFIGVEPFVNGMAKVMRTALDEKLENISLYEGDVRDLLPQLPKNRLSKIYLFFPDPWPKKRHHNRRLFNETTLGIFWQLLRSGGQMHLATDHPDYLGVMQDLIAKQNLFICPAGAVTEVPSGWVYTKYQKKAIREGRTPYFINLVKE